jgi:signal transduction histidine kinase
MRSPAPDEGDGGGRRRPRPLRSVRVRITLAAVAVTALAVGTAGALLVRSVETDQIHQVRTDIEADLDQLVAQLRQGTCPPEAMASMESRSSLVLLQITGRDLVATYATGADGPLLATQVQGRGGATRDKGDTGEDEGAAGNDCAPPGVGGDPPPAAVDGGTTRATTDQTLPAAAPSPTPDGQAPGGEEGTGGTEVGGGDRDAGGGGPRAALGEAADTDLSILIGRRAVSGSYETLTRTVATPDGEVTVDAAVPVDQLAGTVDTLRQGLIVGLPALIAVVAALASVLVGRALRPVEAVRAEVDAITGSTMHRRVPVPPTGDEIGRLARTMNAMLGRLDASATRQRQFVADASHELRSPVAALRTSLEVARRNPDRADWPAVADAALAEEARLESLLDDLLLLAAHDENGAAAAADGSVDLGALAEAESARPRGVPVDVELLAGTDGAPVVVGDADRLSRAVANLVENAARYASGAVELRVARLGDTVRLTVDDDGPGIPADDRERVFERFTRLDDGRARPEGGTGLGLAVVRSIVDQHHGRVRVEDGPLGGARLTVELPAASDADESRRPRRS